MRYTFPSLANPSCRWSIYESDGDNKGYNWTGSGRFISRYISTWDTMNDGEVQHSPDHCPSATWDYLWDFVTSVLPHAHKVEGKILDNLCSVFVPYNLPKPELLDFCATKAVYDTEKYNVYINFSEMKRSTSDSKRYDKRWVQPESYMDGSPKGVRSALSCHVDGYKYNDPIAAQYLTLVIYSHFNISHYGVAREIEKDGKRSTIFNGSTEEQLENWFFYVETIAKMLLAKRTVERMTEMNMRSFEKLTKAVAA